MFGGNSFMRGPGGPGRGPGGFGPRPGGFGPRPGGFGHRPGGPRPGGFGPRPGGFGHFHRRGWGGPPPPHRHGCGCMGCLLPILALLGVIGGAVFGLLSFI